MSRATVHVTSDGHVCDVCGDVVDWLRESGATVRATHDERVRARCVARAHQSVYSRDIDAESVTRSRKERTMSHTAADVLFDISDAFADTHRVSLEHGVVVVRIDSGHSVQLDSSGLDVLGTVQVADSYDDRHAIYRQVDPADVVAAVARIIDRSALVA